MIISHKYKFIFIKTRKTAGTSLELTLGRFIDYNDIITPLKRYKRDQNELNINYIQPNIIKQHSGWKEIINYIGEKSWNDYFKFTIERNPWDKVVSSYFYMKNRGYRKNNLEFKDLLKSKKIFKCYNWHLYANDDVKVDYICKYENLTEDLKEVGNIIGVDFINKMEYKANSQFREVEDYRIMYNKTTENIVRKNFNKEIEYFGYTF